MWTDKSRKWSLRLQRWDTGRKKEKKKKKDPAHLTSHNYKPIPTPQKVKTVMQAPPHVEELQWGGRRKQNTNIKSVPVSTPYKNERNQS